MNSCTWWDLEFNQICCPFNVHIHDLSTAELTTLQVCVCVLVLRSLRDALQRHFCGSWFWNNSQGLKEEFSGCSVQLLAAAAKTMLQRQGGRSLKPLICWENNGNTPFALLVTCEPFHCTVCGAIREGCWEFLLSKQLNNLTILGLGLFSIAQRLLCNTVYEVTSCWKSPQMAPEENEWLWALSFKRITVL